MSVFAKRSPLSFASLRFRLLALVLLAVLPVLGLTLYTASEERRHVAAIAQDHALQLARLAAEDEKRLTEGARQLLIALAHLPSVRSRNAAACNVLFADLLKGYERYANLGAIAPDGHVFCSAVPFTSPLNVADQVYFQRALQTRSFAVGDYQIGRITGKQVIVLAYPALDEAGQVQAVVFAALDLAWLNQLAVKAQLPPGSTLIAIDENGTVLVRYPEPEKWVGQRFPEMPLVKAVLAQGEGTVEAIGLDGIARLYAFASLDAPRAGTYVIIGIPQEVAFAEVDRLRTRNLAALGLVGLLAMAVAWVVSDVFIISRALALMRAAQRLAAGDLTASTGLPHGPDELGQVARAFDQMAQALEQRLAERKRAEEALRTANVLLERTFASLEEAVFVMDPDTCTIITCNPAVERMFGYGTEEVIGRNSEFLHVNRTMYEEFGKRLFPELDAKGVFHAEYQMRRKDGGVFPTEHTVTEIRDDSGRRTGLVSVMRDITERKRAEEMWQRYTAEIEQQVAERTAQLQESNAEMETFVYSVSHDLRAPLSVIQGLSVALLEDYADRLDATGQEYARYIASSAKHLERMIEDLLAYSRLSRAELILQPVSLDAVVEEALGLLEAEIREREAQIMVEKPLPQVMGHQATLVQVMANLVSNAIKFVAPGVEPRVRVWTERAPRNTQFVRLWIEDNGIGIAPENHERIFRAFERLHGIETYLGTGIGLAIVRRGVERLGGRVGVESALGQGSKFWIELPAVEK